ncbi:MAG TPA: J domain-containing protein [Spirochaetia bacterium]|nr:J domain-containing protein [Spirochaetia bacterium]
MDFIDRLADILRSLMGDKDDEGSGRPGARTGGGPGSGSRDPGYRDPDLRAAWEELEDYMRGGAGGSSQPGSGDGGGDRRGAGSAGSSGQSSDYRRRRPEPPADESLRKDFANLEVPFGADIETVRRSYKAMMLKYHPDKFAGDPEKQRVALEITKKINQSFERIRSRQ